MAGNKRNPIEYFAEGKVITSPDADDLLFIWDRSESEMKVIEHANVGAAQLVPTSGTFNPIYVDPGPDYFLQSTLSPVNQGFYSRVGDTVFASGSISLEVSESPGQPHVDEFFVRVVGLPFPMLVDGGSVSGGGSATGIASSFNGGGAGLVLEALPTVTNSIAGSLPNGDPVSFAEGIDLRIKLTSAPDPTPSGVPGLPPGLLSASFSVMYLASPL